MSTMQRQRTLELGDYARPAEIVAAECNLGGWPRARWQALVDRIDSLLSETRP